MGGVLDRWVWGPVNPLVRLLKQLPINKDCFYLVREVSGYLFYLLKSWFTHMFNDYSQSLQSQHVLLKCYIYFSDSCFQTFSEGSQTFKAFLKIWEAFQLLWTFFNSLNVQLQGIPAPVERTSAVSVAEGGFQIKWGEWFTLIVWGGDLPPVRRGEFLARSWFVTTAHLLVVIVELRGHWVRQTWGSCQGVSGCWREEQRLPAGTN